MTKAILVSFLATLMLSPANLARAHSPSNIPRNGYLTTGYAAAAAARAQDLREGLQELGYIEGKNILIEVRYADYRHERLDHLAEELVRLKVDVIVTATTSSALSAQRATKTI